MRDTKLGTLIDFCEYIIDDGEHYDKLEFYYDESYSGGSFKLIRRNI